MLKLFKKNESKLEELLIKYFEGVTNFENFAKAQAKHTQIYRAKMEAENRQRMIEEKFDYFRWKIENDQVLEDADLREYDYLKFLCTKVYGTVTAMYRLGFRITNLSKYTK